jgi:4-amino-4-deoxy-L-arabinose transferase-like glycosyltransferase
MPARGPSAAFVPLLALAFAVRLFLVAAVPTTAPSVAHRLEALEDEPAHLNYIRFLATHRAFPVQTHAAREPGWVQRGDYEYWQPPLYHILCAPIDAAAPDGYGVYACRLLSFVFGSLSLLVLWRILALLDWPDSCRRLGVVFVALLPTNSYYTSLVTNDSLCWLIALLLVRESLVLLDGARAGGPPAGPWRLARIALLLAAGMLTKGAIAIFYPLFLAEFAWLAWRTGRWGVWGGGLVALLLSAAIASPWYARNLATYGSLFATEVGFGAPDPVRSVGSRIYHIIGGTIRYFWFPSSHILPLPIVRTIRALGGVIVLLHGAIALAYVRRPGLDARGGILTGLLGLALAAHVRLNWTWIEPEGRFLFPALATIAFLFVRPTWALLERFRWGEAAAWIWLTLVAIHPWILLAFASPTPLS